MLIPRRAEDRGKSVNSWLESRHTFSFGDYSDEVFNGFSQLKILNDDIVKPLRGFGDHPHRFVEIFTYVVAGNLEYKDNFGNHEVVPAGSAHYLSTGAGMVHSEINSSRDQDLRLIQFWINPNRKSLKPVFLQADLPRSDRLNCPLLLAAPEGPGDNAVFPVKQDCRVYLLALEKDGGATLPFDVGRSVYTYMISGRAAVNGEVLAEGDGAAAIEEAEIAFTGLDDGTSEALVWDLP